MATTTYSPQSGDLLVPGATGVTEDKTIIGGFIAACGQAAVAALLAAEGLVSGTADTVTTLAKQTISAGQVTGAKASSGESSPGNLAWLAQQYGVTLQSQPWQQALGQAGQKPVVLGLSNGAAVEPWAPNLRGHYETVLGKAVNGNFIVSDPNSPQSLSGGLVEQSPAQIAAAQPFWAGVPTAFTSAAGASTATSGGCNNDTFLVGAIGNIFCNLGQGTQAIFQSVVQLLIRAGVILAGAVLILLALIFLMRERG